MKYRTKLLLTAAVGGCLSLAFLALSLGGGEALQTLLRPESGEGDQEQALRVQIGEEKYPLTVTLLELEMGEEEVRNCLAKAAEGLEELFLGENEELSAVRTDLYMPSTFPDSQVSIQWYADSWEYVNPDGSLENLGLTEAVSVRMQAVLELSGQSLEWSRELTILPLENLDGAQKAELLELELLRAQEESGDRELTLPESLLGEEVIWYPEADRRWLWILLLTLASLCAMALGRQKDEEKAQRERERRMQMDYPEIVNRLSLYMGAGISTRRAWERIVESYEEKLLGGGEKREAYEQMSRTLHEMQSGVAEALAYEQFGTRCRLPSYLKLGTLLGQNLRKGTKNLAGLLKEESREAFENRKALAKKLGEECESKLLLPMIMMLLTVLIMVMYPAMTSFQM